MPIKMIMTKVALLIAVALPLCADFSYPSLLLRPGAAIVEVEQYKIFTMTYPGLNYGGVLVVIGDENGSQPNSCLFKFDANAKTVSLLDDAAGTYSAPLPIGVPGMEQNSQCTIDASASSVVLGQDELNLLTTFNAAIAFHKFGNSTITATVLGFGGRRSITPWQKMGTVMVLPEHAPVVQSASTPNPTPQPTDSEEMAFLEIINNFRAQNGAGPLQTSTELENSSRWMSNDLAAHNYFSHTDSLGRDPATRINSFGYSTANSWWGENIAGGFADAYNNFAGWMTACDPDSSGACTYAHKVNMLNPNFKLIGIARAYNVNSTYHWYWTTDFGRK